MSVKAVRLLQQLKEAGEPIVLSINDKVELTVQDDATYQRVVDLVDWMETVEAIRIGLEDMRAGRGRPAEECFEELRRKYNIPRDA